MFVSRAPSSSEEDARRFLLAPPMPITTPSAASAMQDSSSTATTQLVSPPLSPFLTVPPTHSSTVLDAPATWESSSNLSMPVLLAPQVPPGTDRSVLPPPHLLLHAHQDMSTMKTLVSVSLQLLHVVTTPSSTEPPASALMDTTGSTEFASNVHQELSLMALSAPL